MIDYIKANEQAAVDYINRVRGLFLAQIVKGLKENLEPEDTVDDLIEVMELTLSEYEEYIK